MISQPAPGLGVGAVTVDHRFNPSRLQTVTKVGRWKTSNVAVSAGPVVDMVPDLLGGGFHLANTAAARPSYTPEDADFIGKPSLTLNGTSQYLFNSGGLANALCGGDDRAFSIYLVMRFITIPASQRIVLGASQFASGSVYDLLGHNAGGAIVNFRQSGDAQTALAGGTPAANTTYLVRKFYTAAKKTTVKLNATTVINDVAQDNASMGALLDRFALGCLLFSSTASQFANIKVTEMFACLGQPSVEEDALLGAYFGAEYGFTAG